MRNEKGAIITDPTDIQRIITEYYGQLYASKSHNVDETEIYWKIQTGNLNSSVSTREINFIIKNLFKKKTLCPDGFITKAYHSQKKITADYTDFLKK